jgi:hypothetical protein
MAQLVYTPDEDVKVHEENAIKLICSAFQSHESGLPEWLKNSADAYAREDVPEAKRYIIVIFDCGRKGHASSISCLDLLGMTSTVIEESFRIWADPEAARRGAKGSSIQMNFVFTVCDNAANEICPVWPGRPMTAHWGVPDPAVVTGSAGKIPRAFRDAFLTLDRRIRLFLNLPLSSLDVLDTKKAIDRIGHQ